MRGIFFTLSCIAPKNKYRVLMVKVIIPVYKIFLLKKYIILNNKAIKKSIIANVFNASWKYINPMFSETP
jgi:hypothetical protein